MKTFGPAEVAHDGRNALGEVPIWSAAERAIWWVDIRAPALYRLTKGSPVPDRFALPDLAGAYALRADGKLIVALKGRLCVFDPETGALETLFAIEPNLNDNRPNEGRCDPQGRFWFGTMVDLARYVGGALYRVERGAKPTRVLGEIHIPNSLCWGPDGKVMYFSDSPTGEIRAFDFDAASGNLTNGRVHVALNAAPGMPDGSTIDTDGYLWNARHGAGCIARFDPTGRLDTLVELPVSQVTACTFGGDDLNVLYVTSARQRLSDDELAKAPLSGALFSVQTQFRGLPENLCQE